MGRLNKGLISAVVVGALPVAASAQSPFALDNTQVASQKSAEVGGTPAVDIITLSSSGPGAPLRFGNVVPNSEAVQFEGMTLKSGVDYMMDYSVGVVYLMVAQRAGQNLTVSYRYKPGTATAAAPVSNFAGFTTFKYSLVPGQINMLTGLGLAERGTDGSVASSNVYGLSNSLKLTGSTSLDGIYILNDRQKASNYAGMNYDQSATAGKAGVSAGRSELIVQSLHSNFLGGKTSIDYQDISKTFSNFGTASASGIDDATVRRLTAEKGLTRLGFSASDMSLGGLKFSNSYKSVSDGQNGIDWKSFGVANGGFKLNYSSQRVDHNFLRGKDLGEADHDQLAKEAGLSRNNLAGELAQKFGKVSFADNRIVDNVNHREISQKLVSLDAGKYRFDLGNEAVDGGFMRFDSLLAPEKLTFGREAGVKRQWLGFQASFLGKDTPISFNQNTLHSSVGEFKSQDVVVASKTWSLEHFDRGSSARFMSIGAMPDAEIDRNVKTIASMYGATTPTTPNDRMQFINAHGIDRKYDGFNDTFKGLNLSASEIKLKGAADGGKLDTFAISSKNTLLSYRHEDLGAKFSEVTSLMDVEKSHLGTLAGLNRTDLNFSTSVGNRKLAIENMDVKTLTGTAERTTASYSDAKINIQAGSRSVSSAFVDAPSLIDPAKDVLNQMRGFSEQDVKVKWQLKNNMTLDSVYQDMHNAENNQTRNNILNWSPDKNTQINITDLEQRNSNSISQLFDSSIEKISMAHNMGRYGTLTFLREEDKYQGINATILSQNRDYLAYEAKVTANTSFKTEQTITQFANGTHENINSNTISTTLAKNAGVSLTDTQVDRQGKNDEAHRNYGFWYDLGGGVRVSYGYAQQGLPNNQGTSSSSFTVGQSTNPNAQVGQVQQIQQGTVGGMQVGGGYFANQWDAMNRTQTAGNLSLTTAKPFRFGMISNAKLMFNMDTGSDRTVLNRENKLIGGSGNIGTNSLAYEYRSQLDPTGLRAIDRTFKVQTDPSEKKLISANVAYKARTLTNDSQIMIRDFNLVFRPVKNFTLTNLLQTNPEIANPSAILGTIPQASRSNKWQLDYKQSPNMTIGGSWQELLNDQTHSMSRTGGITFKLFEQTGSPLSVFVGVEQASQVNLWRTTERYSIQYDRKPASNQTFSMFFGSMSYDHTTPIGSNARNYTMRLNYQFRF